MRAWLPVNTRPLQALSWLLETETITASLLGALVLTIVDFPLGASGGAALVLRWVIGVPVVLVQFAYGLQLLRQAANGHAAPPAMDIGHLRFFSVPLLCVLWLPISLFRGPTWLAMVLACVALVVLAGDALERPAMVLVNPSMLLGVCSSLAPCIPALTLLLVVEYLLFLMLTTHSEPRIVKYALMLHAPLALFVVLGRCVYERRAFLGFEPVHSPERIADRDEARYLRELDGFFDELYIAVRSSDRPRVDTLLANRPKATDPRLQVRDTEEIERRVRSWGPGGAAEYVLKVLHPGGRPAADAAGTSSEAKT